MKIKPRVKNVLLSLATTASIIGMGVMPAEAQKATGLGSHVKVGTWNNYSSKGYVHGHGRVFSVQSGGVQINGRGHSNMRGCHYCNRNGFNGDYRIRGAYTFERGASIDGNGSFGLDETTHFGAEGSSWSQF